MLVVYISVVFLLVVHSCSGESYDEKLPKSAPLFQGKCSHLSCCSQLCITLQYGGHICACNSGFKLQPSGCHCTSVKTTSSPSPSTVSDLDQTRKTLQDKESRQSFGNKNNLQTTVKKDDSKDVQNDDGGYHIISTNDALINGNNVAKQPKKRTDTTSAGFQLNFESGEDLALSENGARKRSTSPPIKYRTCDDLDCFNGGNCVPNSLRGGVRCQCMLGFDGDFCEREIVVKYPKFLGTGYVAFPVLRQAYKEITVTIEFRPETQNGLLLFSSEFPNARKDFFSVALVNGHVEFRFDCGTGPAILRSASVVTLGEWNKVVVHRTDWNGWLRLNNDVQIKGRSHGLFSRITFRQDLYLGGYSNMSFIGSRTGMKFGFIGCIKSMNINGHQYDMRRGAFVGDAIHGVDVGECSSHVCNRINCQQGGSCVADSPDTFMCMCPVGTAGRLCEKKISVHLPSFSGHSYMRYKGLKRTVLSYTEIEIVFRPTDKNGLLLYNGYTTDRRGDFVSLVLKEGFVAFRFDLGTGPAIIKSTKPITLDEWHTIKISRTGREGFLTVDNSPSVEGMSQGAYTQLTLLQDLFVGGHESFDETSKFAEVDKAFSGCIQKIIINNRPLKLLEEHIEGVNIDACNHPCSAQPCQSGGRCLPHRDYYSCSCPLGYGGTDCEKEITEDITTPMFQGNSYLKFSDKQTMKRIKGKKIDIQVRFRATGPNGLIFWSGEPEMTSSSDYIALGLVNGHVQFSYNLGSGPVIIVDNSTKTDNGKWHKIKARRNEQRGYLEIDKKEVSEGKSPGGFKQLNTVEDLYIGGMPDITENTRGEYTSGLVGCISHITLATDYHMTLVDQAESGQNINQCT